MQDMNEPQSAMPTDHEGAMAKADLYKLANYSYKLFKMLEGNQQLEGWVQAKITKAADYIASVYHYMEYEMKFSEYGEQLETADVYTEGQRAELRNKLMEAKDKIKQLKQKQAEKMSKKDVKEEKSSTGGEIDRSKKGVTKHTQNTKRFSDEPHTEPKSQAKSQSAADKAGEKAADKAEEREGKNWEKRFGKGSVTRVKDGKKVDEALKGKKKTEGELNELSVNKLLSIKNGANKIARDAGVHGDGDMAKAEKAARVAGTASYKAHQQTMQNMKAQGVDPKQVYANEGKGDGNLANNAKPYNKVTRGDVIAGRLGKDEKGGKTTKNVKEAADEKCNHTAKGKKCPVHGLKECSGMKEAAKPDFLDVNKNGNKKEPMKKAVADTKKGTAPKKGVNPFAKKDSPVKKAVAKAKAKMEGSIQGGVWVSSPDKGVAPPQDIDGGSAPAPKKAKSPFPSRNDPAKAAKAAATKPGTANPAMPSRNKEAVKESVELANIKMLAGL